MFFRKTAAKLRSRVSGGSLTIGPGATVNTPLVVNGRGTVKIGARCSLGYQMAPRIGNGANLIQARNTSSIISVGDDVEFSNNTSVIALNKVVIGSFCLIANEVLIFDADFHDLKPSDRLDPALRPTSDGQVGEVIIGKNVWICARSIILRDTIIGDGSVVAAGSVLNGTYPKNSLISGVPARTVRELS